MRLFCFLCAAIISVGCQNGPVDDNFLIVADINDKSLYQIDLSDGSPWKLPLSGKVFSFSVSYNPDDSKVYWTDGSDESIKRSYLNGTEQEVITKLHAGALPVGIAVDFVSRLVYYVDSASDIIAVMTLDGQQHFTLVTGDMYEPRHIALDIPRGMMYWTDQGYIPRILAAHMDGVDRRTVIRFTYKSVPIGLAIDFEGDRLFWCDAYTNTIRSATLQGNDEKIVIETKTDTHFFGMALLERNLYYTDLSNSHVWKINISYPNPDPQKVATLSQTSGIAAYNRELYATDAAWNSSCRHNGGCPYICLATPKGARCACPDGLNFINETECSPPSYKCPLEYTEQAGKIQSPGYPWYRNNLHCLIVVRLNNIKGNERRLVLQVLDFQLESEYDFLVIGKTKVKTLYTGSSYTVTTTDEDFRWLFVTDGSTIQRGFSFAYEVVYCNSIKPCRNGGTCIRGEICRCVSGYEGNWCENENECASNPCRNGGECSVDKSGYLCKCPSGTSGRNCETNTNTCSSHPCLNGGSCSNGIDVYQCKCDVGYTGALCESLIVCKAKPCQNGGICSESGGVRTCKCVDDFTGDNCELSRMTASPETKRLDITVKLRNAEFKETMSDKASEEYKLLRNNVEEALNVIIDKTLGRGKYNIIDVTFSAGSVNVKYEIDVPKDAADPTAIAEVIKTSNGTFAGYDMDKNSVGVTAQLENECASNPCQHGGECSVDTSGYFCRCPSGTSGRNCETNQPSDGDQHENKKGLNITTIGIIAGAVAVFIIVGIAIGETTFCLTRTSRNRATAKEAPASSDIVSGQLPPDNRVSVVSDNYTTLTIDNDNIDYDVIDDIQYDTIGAMPISLIH